MFQFIEFSDFSSQVNSLFVQTDLEPLRQFYQCLELAEDSELDITSKKTSQLHQELQTAVKVATSSTTEAAQISAYRIPFKSAIRAKLSQDRIKYHQQRKNLIRQLTAVGSHYLRDLSERYRDHSELNHKLQRLSILARDPALHFESFSTTALVKLRTIIQDIPVLLRHLSSLKEKILLRVKKSNLSIYSIGMVYIQKLEKDLVQIREAWCENILDRLEKASANHDIYYSDNLFKAITEINNNIIPEKDRIPFPGKARRDLSKNNFIEAHNIIHQWGTAHQKRRLAALSWHQSSSEYVQFPNGSATQVVPRMLAPYLISFINWLYYLCSASYRYRCHFLDRYAHLSAQQKLLSEQKTIKDLNPSSPKTCPELKKLRQLEQEINTALVELDAALKEENSNFIRSNSKKQLIINYKISLQRSLCHIIAKKIEALAQHAELLKIYIHIPELTEGHESRNLTLYQEAEQKKAVLALRQEIISALNELSAETAYSLNQKFKATNTILSLFYKLDPSDPTLMAPSYEASELEKLAATALNCLFLLENESLKFKLEYYRKGYQQLVVKSTALTRHAIEQSLYQFITHYLEFIQEHIHELPVYNEKLSIIENNLIAANPIAAGYLREIQVLRQTSSDSACKAKLLLQVRIMTSAVRPAIKKRSFSATLIRPAFSPVGELEELALSHTNPVP